MTADREILPDGWPVQTCRDWYLATHQGLPVLAIADTFGEPVGWLLGWPIDIEAERILAGGETYVLGVSDEQLFDLGGRWLAILVTRNRIFTDAAAGISAVFMPSRRIVASSTGLLPRGNANKRHQSLVAALQIPEKDNWYPFGLTAHAAACRIMANHVLDLKTFEQRRSWPGSEMPVTVDTQPAVQTIAKIAQAQINSIAKMYPLMGNLTAGRDTRMILAFARTHSRRMEFLTRTSDSYNDRLDADAAIRIAGLYGLKIAVIRDIPASKQQLEEWQQRVGYCVAGAVWSSLETWRQSDPNRANIPGMVGEFGRAFYQAGLEATDISGVDLCQILRLPAHELLAELAESWFRNAQHTNDLSMRQLLDLLYLEQRVSCWAAPTLYGNEGAAPSFWVLSHRAVIRSMLCLPETYKSEKRLPDDLIAYSWPELLRFPFNRPFDIKSSWLYVYGFGRLCRAVFMRAVRALQVRKPH